MDEIRYKYDQLLHLANEVKLPRIELIAKARELFPKFTNTNIYDKVIGSYEIEVYMSARSMGLSIEDAAHSAELSNAAMSNALEGYGVSIEKFINIAKAELFAQSSLITKLLNVIERAADNTTVNAAIALLEKIAPQQYGKAVGLATKTSDGKIVNLSFSLYDPEDASE